MNKKLIIDKMIDKMKQDLSALKEALNDSYETATHEDNIAKNKYDTLALEAGYLVQGQARRSEELEEALAVLESLTLKEFGDRSKIEVSALVTLEAEDASLRTMLIAPGGGGLKVEVEGREITVMTPVTPTGKAVMGQYLGDLVEVELGNEVKDFEIVELN